MNICGFWSVLKLFFFFARINLKPFYFRKLFWTPRETSWKIFTHVHKEHTSIHFCAIYSTIKLRWIIDNNSWTYEKDFLLSLCERSHSWQCLIFLVHFSNYKDFIVLTFVCLSVVRGSNLSNVWFFWRF